MKPPHQDCVLLDPQKPRDRKHLEELSGVSHMRVVDMLDGQIEELYRIRNPQTVVTGVKKRDLESFKSDVMKQSGSMDRFGNWAWYPWGNLLIHFLPEDLHTELRTARNRNLITVEEQHRFYTAHIGIAGLSVGNSVVGTLLHTGGGKHLRLADHDTVSGSNVNRIRTGFDSIGLPKTTVAAREIYLTNPYADIAVYDGISEENIVDFLSRPKKLDIAIDEMDDLYLKILLRVHARAMKIPVVMAADNGDGTVIDIERFDVEPNRPLMHGDIPENELLAIPRQVPRKTAAKIISTWVGPKHIAPRMMSSLMELGKTLYTWPQLGTAATLSGALLSYVVRGILTGQPISQGKFVVKPEELFDHTASNPENAMKRTALETSFLSALKL